jgi:8-oxo-dGTP diphosphatase
MAKFTLHSAVHLFLIHEGKILLSRRYKTGWRDGWYSVPAGHLDGEESVTGATIREVKEETGIDIAREDMTVIHTTHRRGLDREYIDFFITATKWVGEPRIMEPDKCDDLSWFKLDSLPENTLRYIRNALDCYQKGTTFSEFGWNDDAE